MNWANPIYLNLLIIIPFLVFFYLLVSQFKRRDIKGIGDPLVVEKLLASRSVRRDFLKRIFTLIAILFLILALARPQIGHKLTMAKRKGVDILIAIDTSLSMMAEDIKPNRLAKGKLEVSSFIDKLEGDRVGIVTFAGVSFMQCPLTLDYSACKMFLSIVEVGLIPVPGTDIGEAIKLAIGSFIEKQKKYKVLIIITDGEDHGKDVISLAKQAKKEGIVIYTIGIGTSTGEPIPLYNEKGERIGFKKDRSGEVVMSKLDSSILQKISSITNGRFFHASSSGFELDKIYDEINKMDKKELKNRLYMEYEDNYQYFLFIAILFLCLELIIGTRKRS